MSAIRTPQGRTNAKSALGEIQAVTGSTSHTVVIYPAQQRWVHSTLVDEVLNKPADRVVCQSGYHRGIQAETSLQPARDVVLAAALVHVEPAGSRDPPVA